jgi:L,D-transpeptidase ErfK/SrfK
MAVRGAAIAALSTAACGLPAAYGAAFALPTDGSTIVGAVQVVTDIGENTLLDIARRYDLGYDEIVGANPGISAWRPPQNGRIVLPTEFILPSRPWVGIVINVSQRRLFYFPEPKKGEAPQVVTYPLGIAREGWPTPLGRTTIVAKQRDPAWLVPRSIREERRREGEPGFPDHVPPGPDNPMGMHALQTGFRSIFIHSTNRPWGIGMPVTHGCLRLYPEDAAELFARVRIGTPVRIVNEPYVVGISGARLLGSSYEPANDYAAKEAPSEAVAVAIRVLEEQAGEPGRFAVNWSRVLEATGGVHVIPVPLSARDGVVDDAVGRTAAERYPHAPYGADANGAVPPSASSPAPG